VLTRPAPPAPEPPSEAPPPRTVRPEVRRRPATPAPAAPVARAPQPVAPEDEPPPPQEGMLHMRPAGPKLGLDWRTFSGMEPAPAAPKKKGEGDDVSTGTRVARMLAPSAEDNVKIGKVHPQLYDYQRDALSAFHPAETTVDKADGKPSVGGVFRQWWATYLAAIDADNGHAHEHETRAGRNADDGAVELACDVCVTIAFGQVPRLELSHKSSSDELDEAALEAMRFAVDHRPVTEPLWPAGAHADNAAPMRACYRFSASARRLPPVMLPGCAFDEVKMKVGCTWPMKKIFKSNVKLVSAGPG
jgi:hypothetical protein